MEGVIAYRTNMAKTVENVQIVVVYNRDLAMFHSVFVFMCCRIRNVKTTLLRVSVGGRDPKDIPADGEHFRRRSRPESKLRIQELSGRSY